MLLGVRLGEAFKVYPGVVMRVPGGGFYGWRMGDGDGDGKGNEKKRGKMSALFIHAWVPCNASDPRCFPAVLKRRFAAVAF